LLLTVASTERPRAAEARGSSCSGRGGAAEDRTLVTDRGRDFGRPCRRLLGDQSIWAEEGEGQ